MRIAVALRAMAGAEGCDGEPYDLMQVASEHIEKLETENKTYLDEVDRQAEEIINQDDIIEQLQAEVEKYQEYFRSAEFENLDMLFSSDIEHMTALGKEIAKRSKLLLTELTNLKNEGMKKVLFGEVEALQNENVLLREALRTIKSVGPDQDGRFYKVELTKLEGIKEWFKQDDLSRKEITWLIAEVTKLQKLTSQQIDPYAQGQEDAARRCAEIFKSKIYELEPMTASIKSIKKEYSL